MSEYRVKICDNPKCCKVIELTFEYLHVTMTTLEERLIDRHFCSVACFQEWAKTIQSKRAHVMSHGMKVGEESWVSFPEKPTLGDRIILDGELAGDR